MISDADEELEATQTGGLIEMNQPDQRERAVMPEAEPEEEPTERIPK